MSRTPLSKRVRFVVEAAELAFERKSSEFARFKYFCGVCWNKIREGQ